MPEGTFRLATGGRPTPGITIPDHRKRQDSNLHPPSSEDGALSA